MGRRRERNRTALVPVEVQSRVPYVDSVGFRVPERLPSGVFADIRRSLVNEQGKEGSVVLEAVNRGQGAKDFFLVFWIHQPTPRALRLIQEHDHASFYAVHLALDLCVASPEAALDLERHVLRLLNGDRRLPKHPTYRDRDKTHVGYEHVAPYTDAATGEIVQKPARRGSSIVVYSDEPKPSKVTDRPCVHVEYRIGGIAALGEEGFPTPDKILGLDHLEFWKWRLHLMTPPSGDRLVRTVAEIIGRRETSKGLPASAWEKRLTKAEEALKSAFEKYGLDYRQAHGVDVSYVLSKEKVAGKSSPLRLFTPVSAEWMLPTTRENAFWIDAEEARRAYGY